MLAVVKFIPRKSVIVAIAALCLCGCSSETPSNTLGAAVSAPGAATPDPSEANTQNSLTLVTELPTPKQSRGGTEDIIIPGDVLQIDVFGIDKLNRTVTVDASGKIQLPLIGAVTAGGKSQSVVEKEITGRYGRDFVQSPSVALQIKDSSVRRVIVDGEVSRAGAFPVSTRSTLLESLAQAGGFKEIADPTKVYVYRTVDGARLVANYNVAEIRSGKHSDPRVYGGDVVVVFSSDAKVAWQNVKEALGFARSAIPATLVP